MTDGSIRSDSARRIPFSRPAIIGDELAYIAQALASGSLAGGGQFTRRCEQFLEQHLPAPRVLLTHTGTAALEMAAILAEVGPEDEVIMPSFTFPSTAIAFALRGARPVFVDIRADNLNIDEHLVDAAVTSKTRAIVPVHYAGVACAMEPIRRIAAQHGLTVIEDAAHAYLSCHQDRALGTIGQLGCLSFHESKNVTCGEGGALIVNDSRFVERAEIVHEKGTDRVRFLRGAVDKYTWQDLGSSYSPAEITSAFLYGQLQHAEAICAHRRVLYDHYREGLQALATDGDIVIPTVAGSEGNGHLFWLLAQDEATRSALITFLAGRGIQAVFHYVPLHTAPAGRRFGRAVGDLPVTEVVAVRLLRLPLYFEMTDPDVDQVIEAVHAFFGRKR